jgi:hypothetical protein
MAEIESRPREPSITEEIVDMLEANGNVDRALKDRLMLKAIGEILRKIEQLKSLEGRVVELEHRNIATIFIKHPIPTIVSVFVMFVILNTIAHSISIVSWTSAILKWLGFPVPPM